VGTGASYLARLGIVFADPIRLIINRELYMREMSAPQFFEEFGGGSIDLVRWHFKKLAEAGWLRMVRTGQPSGGRGRPQHFYRATEIALIDTETWVTLPLSIRSVFSARTLDQLWDQIGAALKADTFDSRPDRHLTWVPVVLDDQGWRERGRALSECFHSLQHEQDDAKARLQSSGEQPILMTVALSAFESPGASDPTSIREPGLIGLPPLAEPPQGLDASVPESTRIAKVFADPLNLRIITELNLTSMSATQLQAKIGGASVYSFDRRCRVLVEMGWIVKVETKTGGQRRGAKEIFYRAVGPVYLDTETWSDVDGDTKRGASWTTLQQFREKVDEAIQAETFDRRPDRHLTWMPLLVDETGWRQVISLLETFFRSLFSAQDAAKGRLADSGEEGFLATYFVAGFQSPQH
jgi:DNA-binding HxlR family transcriptional regulator/DNA-binding transcriptional ArsR family regulator